MIIVKSIKEKPEECRGCRFHDKEGDCYLLPESRCYETYAEQYEHCPIEEAPDISVGNIDTTTHDSIPAKTGKNDGDRTSGDCISRWASLEKIRTMQTYKLFAGDDMLLINQAEAQTELMMLPSAQPERKTGRWIPFDVPWYRCSECGAVRENKAFMEYYCPNCGADMRGEQE